MRLSPLDIAIIVGFVAAILSLGFSVRLRENTTLQFIAAGRQLTLPVFVATLVATWYGGILGIGESVSYFGLGTWLLLGVPYYVFALVYALVLAKKVREADQISIPERIAHRWGKTPGLVSGGLVFLLGVPAAHVLMLGTLTQALTGWSLPLCVIVATFGSSLFLYRGGLLADARVSLLSFCMMYVGFSVIVAVCLMKFPLPEGWGSFKGTQMLAFDGGVGPLAVLSFFILGAWTLADPGFHQRVASSRDAVTGRNGVLVSIAFWMLFDLLTITTGMYALSQGTNLPENMLLLFPSFGDQVLPSGLKAVFLCGMLGTILTAMVGYSLVSGATLGRDVVCRVTGTVDEAKAAQWSKIGIFISCVCAVALSMAFKSVVLLWYLWAGLMIGVLLIPTLLSYLSKRTERISSTWVTLSMVGGFIISLAWLVFSSRREEGQAIALREGLSFDVGTLLPGALVTGLILLAGWMASSRSKE